VFFKFSKLTSLNLISPALGSINLSINLPRVDLPEPDSPTMPRVLPFSNFKEILSTATIGRFEELV
jgi:hypothetical protein